MPANNDVFDLTEDQTISGNLFANNGAGADTGAGPLIVSTFNQQPLVGGVVVIEFPGDQGVITVYENGDFTFVPGSYWDALAEGGVGSLGGSYQMRDDNNVFSVADFTLNFTGTNDAPVNGGDVTIDLNEDAVSSGQVPPASDVDGMTFTYELVGTAPGLSMDATGAWEFDASDYDYLKAGEEKVIMIDYLARDDAGEASDQQTFTITITGTNDGPVAAVATNSVTEDATVTGSVSATDADDGVASYELTDEAPAGLTFNPNGSYSFDAASYDSLEAGETET
ncbi:VCBS domain-containing protein, partial [Brevundimonas alba]